MTDSSTMPSANIAATDPGAVDAVIDKVRRTYRSWGRGTTVAQMRQDWDRLFAAEGLDAALERIDAGGLPALSVLAPGARADRVVLYFHGGGFQVGSTDSHAELMAWISQAAGCRVVGIDYRLAPEHRHPAASDDAGAAYAWLLAQGYGAAQIALAGDSAGGQLVLGQLLALAAANAPMPACAVLLSAWTDLSASGESYTTRAEQDPIHQRPMIQAMAKNYLGAGADPRDPAVSPLFADAARLARLPPLLVQVGDRETVRSDSVDFAERARAAGATVQLEVWDAMIHVFQQFPRELAEARRAIAHIGDFIERHFKDNPETT